MRAPSPVRGALGALALAAALACGAPAARADNTVSPPPEKFAISPGGVDLRSGRYVHSQTDLSIGGESGGLALTRTLSQPVQGHINPFGLFSHNWDILVAEKRVSIQSGDFRHNLGYPDYQIEVVYGGRQQAFRSNSVATYFEQSSRSGYATLTFTGTKAGAAVYTYTTDDGTVALFRPINAGDCSAVLRCAYVSELTQPDGTRLSFAYDPPSAGVPARLRRVTSNRGYALLFEYGGNRVTRACLLNLTLATLPADGLCPANAQSSATYTYATVAGEDRLATVIDAAGAVWSFVNGATSVGFVKPGQSTPWLTNSFYNRPNDDNYYDQVITAQSFADGQSYAYAYSESPSVQDHVPQIAGGSFTDARGASVALVYDFPILPNSQQSACAHNNCPFYDFESTAFYTNSYQITPGPVSVTDALGRVTLNDYCDPSAMANLPATEQNRCVVTPMPVSVTTPDGVKTVYTNDYTLRVVLQSRQIAKPGSGLPDIVRSATYACSPANIRFCTKPVTVTDPNNRVTEYVYAPEHGGLLKETLPAPAPDAPRPQTRYEYQQRFAWISNGAGGYVQAASPVWLLTATSLCRTSAATGDAASPCAAAGDEVRTAYDYGPDSGPNNLWMRGQAVTADGTTHRTCFRYDPLGRKVAETTANANLGACP